MLLTTTMLSNHKIKNLVKPTSTYKYTLTNQFSSYCLVAQTVILHVYSIKRLLANPFFLVFHARHGIKHVHMRTWASHCHNDNQPFSGRGHNYSISLLLYLYWTY